MQETRKRRLVHSRGLSSPPQQLQRKAHSILDHYPNLANLREYPIRRRPRQSYISQLKFDATTHLRIFVKFIGCDIVYRENKLDIIFLGFIH